MDGTVTIGAHTVTVGPGRRWSIRTRGGLLGKAEAKRLRDQAKAMLADGRGTSRVEHPDMAELARRAAAHKPVAPVVYRDVPAKDWRDDAHDRYGARKTGPQVLGREWRGGNCVRACIGSILGLPIERVPDPSPLFNDRQPWAERYNERLQAATGYRLERVPIARCLAPGNHGLWILAIRMDGPADHVVVAKGQFVIFDPLGEFGPYLPSRDRMIEGLALVRQPTPAGPPRLVMSGGRLVAT